MGCDHGNGTEIDPLDSGLGQLKVSHCQALSNIQVTEAYLLVLCLNSAFKCMARVDALQWFHGRNNMHNFCCKNLS